MKTWFQVIFLVLMAMIVFFIIALYGSVSDGINVKLVPSNPAATFKVINL